MIFWSEYVSRAWHNGNKKRRPTSYNEHPQDETNEKAVSCDKRIRSFGLLSLASHRLACADESCRHPSTETIHLMSEGYGDIVRQLTVLQDKTSLWVEVNHAQASERHGGNYVQVCRVGPSTGKRAGIVRGVVTAG